jgi:hypothetical protein
LFQRDYILRMIEQLTHVMARFMKLKAQEKHREALVRLEEFYGKLMLPKAALLLKMPDKELLSLLSVNGEPDLDKTASLGLLFKEEGRVYEDLGNHEESSARFNKALFLFLISARMGADVPGINCHSGIEELRKLLRTYRIPLDNLILLLEFEIEQGHFGAAEDVLFELMEAGGGENHLSLGEAFFGRLLELTDDELEAGGLPRAEVEQGRLDMLQRFGAASKAEQ